MNLFRKFLASLTPPLVLMALTLSLIGGAINVIPARAATFTVTKTADTNDGLCNADCSLREAIGAANASPGADVVSIPPGTYTLTIANGGGTNEDNNATGDLDILESITLQGAGSGITIIQAGTTTSNGIDKVLAVNPVCTSVVNATIDGLTIRFGRNTQPSTAPDFSFTGGGIDYCAGGGGGTFTLSNSVVSDNSTANGYGGGLNMDAYLTLSYTANITNVTFSNNSTLSLASTATGGAINIFGDQAFVTISGSTFTSNSTANTTSIGGAIYFRPSSITASSLNISNSTFSSNTAAGSGGAIGVSSYAAGATVSISNSSFTGNTATNSFGGALYLDNTTLNTTPFPLTHLTITGNTAGNAGGGVYVGKSNVTMSKSFIVGNTAPTASGLRKSVDVATATVENNWWGCSTGPGAGPCDTASTAGGTLDFNPWYRNQLTATTSPLVTNQTTSLTASFLTNSASSAVPLADISEIIGKSVTWAGSNGNLSSTQTTVQAAGTATGSFQATSAGTAVISAKVSNDNTAPVSSNVLSITVNKANTTAAITSDTPDPSVTGQPVAVTYTVTGQFGNSPTAPTGNVTVTDGVDSCTATVAAGTCNITFRTAGAKTLTATYAGDSNFNASPDSASVAHTVNKADTTTTITSDAPDPSVTGQTVTFNVTVAATAPGAAVAPTTITGSVTVSDGGSNSCIATLTAGAGSCTIAFPATGAYTMSGVYGGDSNFNGSTSATEAHQVNKADTTTAITSDAPDSSEIGQTVTVNFTVVANAPGAGTPTGSVTVSDGVDSCVGTVAAGTCNLALSTPGARTLTATYAGDSNFNGSVSANELHTVTKHPTTTAITSDSPDASVTGQAVTVQFAVTTGTGTATGNVTVSDGTDSCIGTVAAGQCDITFTSAGAKTLTATYAGDATHDGSVSANESHTVNKADTTTAITSDAPDSSALSQTVTVNFTVVANAPGAGTPTGNVTVSDGVDSCIGTVAAGSCNITLTTLGARTLTATYAGDSNFNGSVSAGESHTVTKHATTTTITSDSPDASVTGQTVTIQFTVTTGSGTATGNVTVSDGTDSCVATVAVGQCDITFATAGAKTLTATYAGDATHDGSVSASESHTVNKAGTTSSITSDAPDSSLAGTVVTVNFTVVANAPGAGTPTGNVTVSDGVDSCIGTVAAGTCDITLTTIGARTLTATYAGDSNFNGSVSTGESHTVDGYPTTTSITSDSPDASVTGQTVTVQFTVTTGTGTPTGNVTVTDGTDSCIGTVAAGQCDITFSSAGAKSLTATYAGDLTHIGSVSASESHTVNKADTTTTITSDSPDPSSAVQVVTVNFTVVANAPGAGTPTGNVTVSDGVDSCVGTVAAGTCNLTLTTDGLRSLTATYAGDSNFNGSVSSPATTHTVDGVAPNTSIDSTPTDPSSDATPTFQFSGSDPGGTGVASFECKLDAGVYAPCVTPFSSPALLDGSHTFYVRAIDAVGNVDASPASYTWTVDTTGPDTIIDSNPANPTSSTSAAFTYHGDDGSGVGVTSFECQLDGGGFSSCASIGINYSGLSDGSHTFMVRAIDSLGNVDPTPASFTWLVDTTGPDTTITANPSNPTNSTSASFSFTGNDGGGSGVLGFECDLDGGGFSACVSPHNYPVLGAGSHTFQVRAIDAVGNADATPASFTWTIDLTAPDVTINKASGQADPTTAATINFTVTFTEAVSDFNDASDVNLSASTATGALSAVITGGPTVYNVAVSGMTGSGDVIATIPASSAVDAAGNTNNASTSTDNVVAWVLDTTDPDTTITSHPADPSNNASPFFAFTGSDDHTAPASLAFECQIDGGGFSACASPHNYAGLGIGFHTFDVRAIDEAGNTDSSPASYTWEITPGPTATFIGAACTDTAVQASGRIRFLFSNPSGNPLTITLASNSNPDLVKNRNVIWTISGSNVNVLLKNIYGKNGVAVLTLNVSDGLVTTPVVITVHVGGNGDDVITGTTGLDFIFGLNGNDTLYGDDGSDILCGGLGNDTLNGDADNDYLDGGFGNDTLNGGDNDDYLRGNAGVDTMTGGLGADFFSGGFGVDIATDYNTSEGDTKDATTP